MDSSELELTQQPVSWPRRMALAPPVVGSLALLRSPAPTPNAEIPLNSFPQGLEMGRRETPSGGAGTSSCSTATAVPVILSFASLPFPLLFFSLSSLAVCFHIHVSSFRRRYFFFSSGDQHGGTGIHTSTGMSATNQRTLPTVLSTRYRWAGCGLEIFFRIKVRQGL